MCKVDVGKPREAFFENFWREIRRASQRKIKSKSACTAPYAPEVCKCGVEALLYNRRRRLDPSANKAIGALQLTRMQSTGTMHKLRVPLAAPLQRLPLLERLIGRRPVQVGVRSMQCALDNSDGDLCPDGLGAAVDIDVKRVQDMRVEGRTCCVVCE